MASEKQSTQPILTQSLFQTSYVPRRSWRSYLTSTAIHTAIVIALLLITFPAIHNEVVKEHIELIAPVLPAYHPKTIIPPSRRVETTPTVVHNEPKPIAPPIIKPPAVKPVVAPKQEIAKAPDIKPQVTPVRPLPDMSPEPPAPKPPVRTGTFQSVDVAKAAPAPKQLRVGGFGDPNGVPAANANPSPVQVAQLGSFDQPMGTGSGGGGGHKASGGVRATSFGSPGDESGAPGGTGRGHGSVHTGSFGETALNQATNSPSRVKPPEPVFSPVEILSKPKPRYTVEARNLKLEGQVSLEVVFQANGSIRIVRVVHGLGHGLDEAAEQAAREVHFRPATRGGVPVDSSATILITFQLT